MRSYKAELSKEEVQEFPIDSFKGEIFVVDDLSDVNQAIDELLKFDIVGFDTETRPSFKKGRRNRVALLQLSTINRAYLFRLNRIGLPERLTDFLSNKNICKSGVAIGDDIKGLKKWSFFEPHGFVELQDIVSDYGIKSMGLKKLAAIVLGFTISKRQQVTNWENDELTDAQIVYAATDAWVCNLIYRELINGEIKTKIDG